MLDIDTVLTGEKTLTEGSGKARQTGEAIAGYEMHVGETSGPDTANPLLEIGGQPDGAVARGGQISGCYVHGLFTSDGFRTAFLQRLHPGVRAALHYEGLIDDTLDALAAHLEDHLDVDGMIDV